MQSNIFACRMMFFVVSFYVGLWTIRIPDIKDQINTDYLGIGFVLMFFAIGSILTMINSSSIIKKYSSKKILKYSAYLQGLLWLPVPFITNFFAFLVIAFLAGCIHGLFEVAMNFQASNLEKESKKSMMAGFHAFYSLGLLLGSIFTTIMIGLGVSFLLNVIIVVLLLFSITIYFARMLNIDKNNLSKKEKDSIFFLWPLIIIVIVIFTITVSFVEGAVDSWAALYMRDIVIVSGLGIGLGTISFNFTMLLGRLVGDRIRDIIGTFNFLLCLIIFSIIGLSIIINFSSIYSAIIGFGVTGLGMSSIVPLAYSIAGNLKDVNSAVAISIISISAYGTFMIAPALLGIVANFYGLNLVFLPMIYLLIFCFILLYINKKLFI